MRQFSCFQCCWKGETDLFDDIRRELLLRERDDHAIEAFAERAGEAMLVHVQDVLNDIVAIGVLHQNDAVFGNMPDQLALLMA